ncbi:MAG: Ig-like domain-containing protein [Planctomycetota bacterium]
MLLIQPRRVFASGVLAALFLQAGCGDRDHSGPSAPIGIAPTIDAIQSPTSETTVTVTGATPLPNSTVDVAGGASAAQAVSGRDRAFSVVVALRPDRAQTLYFSATSPAGDVTPPTAVEVVQDGTSPVVAVDFPAPDADVVTATTVVAGRVRDGLSGAAGLDVTVNGLPATVDLGIGPNATFFADDVPLSAGQPTTLTVVARDRAGNEAQDFVLVNYLPPTGNALMPVDGAGQSGQVGSELPMPLTVQVTRPDRTPFVGKPVTFEVVRSDGRLAATAGGTKARVLTQTTDANGRAGVYWTLGADAGVGNNRVAVTSKDIVGTVSFIASATAAGATQINIGSGNNQIGSVDAPLLEPLVVWVNDGCNGVRGVDVTFRVAGGNGSLFTPGSRELPEATVTTGATGHAQVGLELGETVGNTRVEATFAQNQGPAAAFVARGIAARAGETTLTGAVLDNVQRGIAGATCTLVTQDGATQTTQSESDGAFRFDGIVPGPARLDIDGSTASGVGGGPLPTSVSGRDPVRYPALHYEPYVLPGAANTLPTPVHLPALDPVNDVVFDGSADVELCIAGIDGLQLFVSADTKVTLPDGRVVETGSGEAVTLSLNQVHVDDVPMPMPDGAAPPFAWTLQPGGAVFDPPVQIVYPNMSGLPPGATTFFLSFDHDTGDFEIVSAGMVTPDGSCIESDPNGGLAVAGWGCNCPPYAVTGDCKKCEGEPNGCGPAWLGPIGPALANCFAVGLTLFTLEKVCFTPDCNRHDLCYARKGVSRSGCDDDFHSDMCQTCESRFSGTLEAAKLLQCKIRAAAYYKAVQWGGQGAYDDAQKATCECLEQSASPVRLPPELDVGFAAVTAFVDDDDDFMDDQWELLNGLDPTDPADNLVDLDGDGLVNLAEFMNDTSPRDPDVNQNGVPDGDDVAALQDPLPPVLDASWTVTVNGQTVPVDADGRFDVANIAAADSFGAGGPGSRPDFISDDAFRVLGVRSGNGPTLYAFSEPFRIHNGETAVVPPMTITSTAPPVPQRLVLSLPVGTLRVGEVVQATVTATLADGSTQDVTARTEWTTYRTSNPAIATVDENGLVTGIGQGLVMITATNGGVATVHRAVVTDMADPLTTIIGFVELQDGMRVPGASISVVGLPHTVTTGANGSYRLDGVPTAGVPQYDLRARATVGGQVLLGTEPGVRPVPGGITDAGLLALDVTGGFGPIILSGMDPEDHDASRGGAGWEMIQDTIEWVVTNSALSATPGRVLQLGGSTTNAEIARTAAEDLGYTFTHRRGTEILAEDLMKYDAVYMPTTADQVFGGLTSSELDMINMRGDDVVSFVNAGGGLVAFSQEYANAYQWFPLAGLTTTRPSGSTIQLTPEGQFVLSASATAVQPFHTAFTGPAGFFGMDVLAFEGDGNQLPLILGGIIIIQ